MDDARLRESIEHTLLSPEARRVDVERLVAEAVEHGFGGVCVASSRVDVARAAIDRAGGKLRLVTVIGYPNGSVHRVAKLAEARAVCDAGADELDVVVDLGAYFDGDHRGVLDALTEIVVAAQLRIVKVILETGLLGSDDHKAALGRLALAAGAHYLKTSTGIPGRGGATEHDVALLRSLAPECLVKASGGIRTRAEAEAMLQAGASRIGSSAGARLLAPVDVR